MARSTRNAVPAVNARPIHKTTPSLAKGAMAKQYFKRVVSWIAKSIWIICIAVVLFFNLRLYAPSPLAPSNQQVPPDVVYQLNASRKALENGAATEMQKLFPEGYFFCYALYGLTWIETAIREPDYAAQAIIEAKWAMSRLESNEGRRPYPADLPPHHGMFYSSWRAHLQAGIVAVQNGQNSPDLQMLQRDCDQISAALKSSPTPFLESYHGHAWPCDTFPGIHAMATYDRLTGNPRYQATIDNWLAAVKDRLDAKTGMIPHKAGLPDGRSNSVARATSQVLMLRFLPDIDPEFAREQYAKLEDQFVTTFIGMPSVLEYPHGVAGIGDVDSGELIFGNSLSATVFMIGLAQIYGDQPRADAIAIAGETVGIPWTTGDEKRYVAGLLPIGDIMVTYSQNARIWTDSTKHHRQNSAPLSRWWRAGVHLLSCLIFLPAIFLLRRRNYRWKRPPRGEGRQSTRKV